MIVNGNKLLIKKNTLTMNQTFTLQIYELKKGKKGNL